MEALVAERRLDRPVPPMAGTAAPVASMFTGADMNNTSPGPNVVPYSSYRFNAMQWDPGSGQYNMGFRNYDPGLGSFDSRDMYEGAGADMALTSWLIIRLRRDSRSRW